MTMAPKLGRDAKFVGVYGVDVKARKVWRLIGPPITPAEREAVLNKLVGLSNDAVAAVMLSAPPSDDPPTVGISTFPATRGATIEQHQETTADHRVRLINYCPVNPHRDRTVYVRISTDPWKTVSVYKYVDGGLYWQSGLHFEPNLPRPRPRDSSFAVIAMLPLHDANQMMQLAAWDKAGRRLGSGGTSRSTDSPDAGRVAERIEQRFLGESGELDRIELQRRTVAEYPFAFTPPDASTRRADPFGGVVVK